MREIVAETAAARPSTSSPRRTPCAGRYRGAARGPLERREPAARARVVYYWLKEKPKGEVTLEMLDAGGTLVQHARAAAEPEPTGSSEYVEDERGALNEPGRCPRGRACSAAVWDLTWDGAEMIPGGDARLPAIPLIGPPAVPGTYTVRLTADGKTADGAARAAARSARRPISQAELEEQLRFALEVRDAITRLTRIGRAAPERPPAARGAQRAAGEGRQAADLVEAVEGARRQARRPRGASCTTPRPRSPTTSWPCGAAPSSTRASRRSSTASNDGDGAADPGHEGGLRHGKKELARLDAEWKALLATDLAALQKQAQALDCRRSTCRASPGRIEWG